MRSGRIRATFRRRAPVALALTVLVAGVVSFVLVERLVRDRDDGRDGGVASDRAVIGWSVAGRPIERIAIGSAGADAVVDLVVLASIHGNEPAGTPLVEAFAAWLRDHPEAVGDGRVLLVPVANPDGFARGERLNGHGVDLNRNFPAGNRIDRARFGEEALSEPESRALHDLLAAARPRAVVSIHQPLACIDFDGPADDLAAAMAAVCTLPVRRLGARPGSLGSWAGESMGWPTVTLELPRPAPSDPWHHYGAALRAALDYALAQRSSR